MPAAKNEHIRSIVMDRDFHNRVAGGIVRRAQEIADEDTPSAQDAAWSASSLRDLAVLHSRRSSLVDSMAEAIVGADMTANPTRSPQEIATMGQSQLDAYITTYSAFFASNPPPVS